MQENSVVFEIKGPDYSKLKKFERQHKKCPCGSAFDKMSYSFNQTSLGIAITVKCSCGQTLHLGNFLDMDNKEYDENAHKPLTSDGLKNKKFEELAHQILLMENPRYFAIGFGTKLRFDPMYYYAVGLAAYGDERISRAILYKQSLNEMHSYVQNYDESSTDEEKIKIFFEHFRAKIREEVKKYNCENTKLLEQLKEE